MSIGTISTLKFYCISFECPGVNFYAYRRFVGVNFGAFRRFVGVNFGVLIILVWGENSAVVIGRTKNII